MLISQHRGELGYKNKENNKYRENLVLEAHNKSVALLVLMQWEFVIRFFSYKACC